MNQTLKNALNGDLRKYKSIPFWSWNNYLDERGLISQIEDMYEAASAALLCTRGRA